MTRSAATFVRFLTQFITARPAIRVPVYPFCGFHPSRGRKRTKKIVPVSSQRAKDRKPDNGGGSRSLGLIIHVTCRRYALVNI